MTSTHPRRALLRSAVVGVVVAGTATACSGDGPESPGPETGAPSATGPPPRHVVLLHDDARATALAPDAEGSAAAAVAVLARSTAVVVSSARPEDLARGSAVARALRIPLLVDGPDLPDALERLDTRTVVRIPPTADPTPSPGGTGSSSPPASALPTAFGDREVVDAGAEGTPEVTGLPASPPAGSVVLVTAHDATVPDSLEALLSVVSADRVRLHGSDPRASTADADALRPATDAVVVGVGDLGPHFAQRVRTVRTAPELPGGGLLPFPGRRMVALYGHPSTGGLGMLGEQSVAGSVSRARRLAAEYEPLVDEPVVPAFELIATVAAGSAGADGLYSIRTPVSTLRPWVDAALEAGIYVVLDLQPGRASFLAQAKAYESLLRRPHVGLALDPEWRLGPSEKPLQQIGHVDIDEVNETGRWLAELVRDHDLPPKVLTLHQFRTSMVRHRERLDTDLDEVQWLVHADGQGGQSQKQDTWSALKEDLPDGVRLGWKNFEDEDLPMLSPQQTIAQVHPTPWFVSYQ